MQSQTVGVQERQKIYTLEDLARITNILRDEGKVIAHCHGVFDLLHIGHIWHLKEAKQKADVLVVTITPDRFVNKGPHRPAFAEELRLEQLAALDMVDFVAINNWPEATNAIKLVRPHFYVKGPDYKNAADDRTGKIVEEEDAVKSIGGEIMFTEGRTYSSTTLINQHLSSHTEETKEFLQKLKEKYTVQDIVNHIESLKDLDVLVLGETIIDEYQYCEAIGKSSKEPTLVVKLGSKEVFGGGILNIANHAAGFSNKVSMITQIGDANSYSDFVESIIDQNISKNILVREGAPTIVKRRYIDKYFFSKIFETYEINDTHLSESDEKALCAAIEKQIQRHDLVLIADYGHDVFTNAVIDIVKKNSKFLVVNVQSNAGNLGYQSMKKYEGADMFSVDENEIRLEARDRRGEIADVTAKMAAEIKSKALIVTRGKNGSVYYEAGKDMLNVPAFAGKVVDRVGAGDAFLTVAAMCAAKNVPTDITMFLGSVAGALAVAIVGNKTPIKRLDLIRSVESLLK